jgi:hypothetical protein
MLFRVTLDGNITGALDEEIRRALDTAGAAFADGEARV